MSNFYKYASAVCLAFASSMAMAEGFYVGAGAYTTSVDDVIDGATIDDSDTTMAVFVGWRPIELLGVEAGYFDLGSYEIDSTTEELDAAAYTLAGVLTVDLGPVCLYGKACAAQLELEVDGWDDSSAEPFAALGAYVDIMDTFYIYEEAMRIQADVDIDLLGAGIRVDF